MIDISIVTERTVPNELTYELSGQVKEGTIRTIMDLIKYKVRLQVTEYNSIIEKIKGPSLDEKIKLLSRMGYITYKDDLKKLDIEAEIQQSLESFKAGEICIMIDGARKYNLTDSIRLKGDENITFLIMVPLTGG